MSAESDLLQIFLNIGGNYLFIVLGVLVSFLLPVLRKAIPNSTKKSFAARFGDEAKPYLIVLAFSLLVGFLMLAALPEAFDWKTAILTGYAWDSTLQKIKSST